MGLLPLDDLGTCHLRHLPRRWAVCCPERDSSGFLMLRDLIIDCREAISMCRTRDHALSGLLHALASEISVDSQGNMDLVPFVVAANDLSHELSRPNILKADRDLLLRCSWIVSCATEFASHYGAGVELLSNLRTLTPEKRSPLPLLFVKDLNSILSEFLSKALNSRPSSS